MKRTSAELKRMAREKLSGHWGIMIGAFVLMMLIVYAVEMPIMFLLNASRDMAERAGVTVIFGIVSILISFVAVILQAGVAKMQLKLARGQEISLGMMFSQFTNRPYRYILGSLLLGVIAMVCFAPGYTCVLYGVFSWMYSFVAVGTLLMIAGGILYIILVLNFSLFIFLFLDDSNIGVLSLIHI